MIVASVVLPNPGGPNSNTWSSASPRALAAASAMASCSFAFSWPMNSARRLGRSFSSTTSSSSTLPAETRRSASAALRPVLFESNFFLLAKSTRGEDKAKPLEDATAKLPSSAQPQTRTTHGTRTLRDKSRTLASAHEPLPAKADAQTHQDLLRRPRAVPQTRPRHRRKHQGRFRRAPKKMLLALRLASRRGISIQGHRQTASPRRRRSCRRPHCPARFLGSQGHQRRPQEGNQGQVRKRLPPRREHPFPVPRLRRPLPGRTHRFRQVHRHTRKPRRSPRTILRVPPPS